MNPSIPNPPANAVGTSPSGITYAKGETKESCAFSCNFDPKFQSAIDQMLSQAQTEHEAAFAPSPEWPTVVVELKESELKLEWKTDLPSQAENSENTRQIFNTIINKIIEL